MKHYFTLLCVFTLFTACKNDKTVKDNTPTETLVKNEAFSIMLNDFYEEGLKLNPLSATSAGDNRYNNSLPNTLTDTFSEKEKVYYSDFKSKAASYSNSQLNAKQQLSRDILIWDCDINLERFDFNENYTPINQMWTKQLTVGTLASGASSQPFKTVEDYDNWLQRVDQYLEWVASAETKMKAGIDNKHVLPKALIAKVVPQLKTIAETTLEDHLFYTPIKNLPDSFSDEDKTRLTTAYANMVSNKVIPAYTSLYNFMKDDYMAAGRTTSGIDDTPNGKAYYEHQIKLYTTTTMTADQIHNLGLSEVKRILAEMEKVKTQVGYEGDIISFFDYVRNNKDLTPYTTPKQIIDNFNAIHETMKPQIAKLFDVKPKTAFEVRQTEKFREASASAEYNPGSLDGTRPGIFYTPIPDASKYNVFSDEALFLHEAIPGHHYQISLQQEDTELPKFRKTLWYSAYGEGWALYCESLGKELGLYTDPYQYFGMLGMEMHRAIRLVVDTGMHTKGWTREQAIKYSLDHEAENEASIISEIERYMANPGQALSYKIGQLKIMELRAKAEQALGDRFDIAQFHNQVLEPGCVPLALLETKIDQWIEASK
ncbi:DUF885 domain-containing protein [Olleya sp. HaHaR_3_96]|uniref:DUF885 domain-containing protein n=1 Tax=Olleya sp. HaHaR_3_96 TaxID=2745560 RepID=UPI001C4FB451|nr:DUF885 domain-containing protein [Olleya sp. HaHaR_3_96]QXP61523.1 DUF885 domain-containing protein [Olleya sp. HaHaR_3_96]